MSRGLGSACHLGTLVPVRTVEYAPGRLADVFGRSGADPRSCCGTACRADARAAVRPLAGLLAGHGAAVVAPDWNSHARRRRARGPVAVARLHRGQRSDGIVLVGWSLGGAAAAGLTIDGTRFDVALAHTMCLAGAFMAPDPISGRPVTDRLSARPRWCAVHAAARPGRRRGAGGGQPRRSPPASTNRLAGRPGGVGGRSRLDRRRRVRPGRRPLRTGDGRRGATGGRRGRRSDRSDTAVRMMGGRADRPAAVDVRHGPDQRPIQRQELSVGQPVAPVRHTSCPTCWLTRRSWWSASSAATAPGKAASTRCSPAGSRRCWSAASRRPTPS